MLLQSCVKNLRLVRESTLFASKANLADFELAFFENFLIINLDSYLFTYVSYLENCQSSHVHGLNRQYIREDCLIEVNTFRGWADKHAWHMFLRMWERLLVLVQDFLCSGYFGQCALFLQNLRGWNLKDECSRRVIFGPKEVNGSVVKVNTQIPILLYILIVMLYQNVAWIWLLIDKYLKQVTCTNELTLIGSVIRIHLRSAVLVLCEIDLPFAIKKIAFFVFFFICSQSDLWIHSDYWMNTFWLAKCPLKSPELVVAMSCCSLDSGELLFVHVERQPCSVVVVCEFRVLRSCVLYTDV